MVDSVLPDGTYDALVVDVNRDAETASLRVDLVVTSGEHKGEVVSIRATNLGGDELSLLGTPATIRVREGAPAVTFEP